jgi:chromosome segregation ATPase
MTQETDASNPLNKQCAVAELAVFPQLNHINRQQTEQESTLRSHTDQLSKLWVWKDESEKRIKLLETAMDDQRKEGRILEHKLGEVKEDLAMLKHTVAATSEVLTERADRNLAEFANLRGAVTNFLQRMDTKITEDAEKHAKLVKENAAMVLGSAEDHAKRMRLGNRILLAALAVAGLLALLHADFAGEPVWVSLKGWLPLVGS